MLEIRRPFMVTLTNKAYQIIHWLNFKMEILVIIQGPNITLTQDTIGSLLYRY